MKFNDFFETIFPNNFSCLCCGRDVFDDEYIICDQCKNSLPYLTGRLCQHCSEPLYSDGNYCMNCKGSEFYCDKIISPFAYTDIIKKFVVGLKYGNKKYYALCLGAYMNHIYALNNFNCDLIIPVPLCAKRLKERGYNQAELLAKVVANISNIKLDTNLLTRIKQTPTQVKLTHSERLLNLTDAFKVTNKKAVKNKIILLIDDVYTTGATIAECAKTLKLAGAKAVYTLTAAHTIFKNQNKTLDEIEA